MTKVREISWPDEFSELKRMEETMICGICYEYMETSVMTPCSHSYCSMCIRKYLHYKSQCPACFHVFFEKDLYINRSKDVLIEQYLQLREKLKTLIENRAVYNAVMAQEDEQESSSPPIRPNRSSPLPKTPRVAEKKNSVFSSPIASTSKQNFFNSNSPSTSQPKLVSQTSSQSSKLVSQTSSQSSKLVSQTSSKSTFSSPTNLKSKGKLPSIAKIFSTPKRNQTSTQEIDIKMAACPVCDVNIPEIHMNVHLDACLKREQAQKDVIKQKPVKPNRPPLPKLVLRVMKDPELRKKMKELGLPTQGDRRALESRFTRYSVIYNAECDKLNPRPIPDLIRQCEMEEKQERKMDSYLVSTLNRFQIDKNAKEDKIDEAQKNYRVTNKSSFDKLIEEVRNRRKLEKEKSLESEEKASTSTKSPFDNISKVIHKNISSHEEKVDNNQTASEIAFQDSDSEESCPLVHYENNGSKNYCSVDLNESSSSPIKSQEKKTIKKQNDTDSPEVPKITSNFHEISSDDEVENSPQSKECADTMNRKIREAEARDMCNSIIDDFSFEDFGEDSLSLSEFNKTASKVPEEKNLDEDEVDDSLVEINKFNRLKLQKNSDEEKVDDEFQDDKSDDAFPLEILNGDSFDEFVNNSHMQPDITSQSVPVEVPGSNALCSKDKEKENDALSANENSQNSVQDSSRRPVRKRSRPARFGISEDEEKEDEEEKRPSQSDSVVENTETSENLNIADDTSLKRRRGRPKANPSHDTSDDSLNPPKRPVRRRQAPMLS